MEKTIKKDRERFVLKEELVNDNTLLEYTYEGMNIHIGVRYVDSPVGGIKETHLCTIHVHDYQDMVPDLIRINDDRNAIAVFKRTDKGLQLDRLYDAESHGFVVDDFRDQQFKEKFPYKPLPEQLLKKK